jgi:hypothetical protein
MNLLIFTLLLSLDLFSILGVNTSSSSKDLAFDSFFEDGALDYLDNDEVHFIK